MLYRHLAERLQKQMETGVLGPGQRLPSLRSISGREKCSLSTALEAYHLLEREGWIEIRPQSGHFVRRRPATDSIRHVPEVSIDDRIGRLLQDLADPRIVPFGAAVPSDCFLPLAQISRSIARANRSSDSHRYEMPAGDVRLRRLLAVRLSSAGRSYSEDDVVITNGCTEALALSLMSTTSRGDAVLVESPSWFGTYQILERLGLRAIEIPSSPETGADVHAFAEAARRHRPRVAVLIPNFANPTGSLMSVAAKRAIADIARREGIIVLEDNIYAELGYADERPESLLSFSDVAGITCGSVSKIIAPGLRIGWAVSREFGREILARKRVMNLSTNRLAQWGTFDLMQRRSYDVHLRRMRSSLSSLSRQYILALTECMPGVRIAQPAGGFVLWAETPGDTEAFVRRAAQERISLIQGSLFDASGSHRNCFRLNCGVEWTQRSRGAVRALGRLYRETVAQGTG